MNSAVLVYAMVLSAGLPERPADAQLLLRSAFDYRAAVCTELTGHFGSVQLATPLGQMRLEQFGAASAGRPGDLLPPRVTSSFLAQTASQARYEALTAIAAEGQPAHEAYQWFYDDGQLRTTMEADLTQANLSGSSSPSGPAPLPYDLILEALGLTFRGQALSALVSDDAVPLQAGELPNWAVGLGRPDVRIIVAPDLNYAPVRIETTDRGWTSIRQFEKFVAVAEGVWLPTSTLLLSGTFREGAAQQPKFDWFSCIMFQALDAAVGPEAAHEAQSALRLPVGGTAFVNGQPKQVGVNLRQLRETVISGALPWEFVREDLDRPVALPDGLPVHLPGDEH